MNDQKKPEGVTLFQEPAATAEAFLLCTPAGRVLYANGLLKLLVEQDLTGRNLSDFLEDGVAARLVAETLAGRSMRFHCDIRGQGFQCVAEPWEGHDGIQIELFPVNRMGGGGLGTASSQIVIRELNNSLAVLLPAVQVLEEKVQPSQESYLAMMKLHVCRLMRLSRNLEDIALSEKGELRADCREEDLTGLLRELLERAEPYCKALGIHLQSSLPEEPLVCLADREKLQRMVLNLLSAAMEEQRRGGGILVTLREKEDAVVLSVSGSRSGGAGLSEGAQRMEPSREALGGGLGMEIALARAFAEAHDGQLMTMSNDRSGASARAILPRRREAPGDVHTLRAWTRQYGTGIDMVAVELSAVSGRELYGKKPSEQSG